MSAPDAHEFVERSLAAAPLAEVRIVPVQEFADSDEAGAEALLGAAARRR